jgi:hypothetical protein
MVFFPNPPVEDAAGGEADKSLRLPCEMLAQLNLHLIFNRGVGPTGRRLDLKQKTLIYG